MVFKGDLSAPEAPSIEEIKIAEALRRMSAVFPRSENAFESPWFSGNSGSGEINDLSEVPKDKTIVINTDTGGVIRKDQEAITPRLYGCAGVFIQGAVKDEFVHMTPNSYIGYKYRLFDQKTKDEMVEENVEKIRKAFAEGNSSVPLEKSVVTIFVNMTRESGDGDALRSKFLSAGFQNVKIVELPLDETTLYHTPLKPDEMVALGRRVHVGDDGDFKTDEEGIVDQIRVSLNPNVQEDFGVKRPMTKRAA